MRFDPCRYGEAEGTDGPDPSPQKGAGAAHLAARASGLASASPTGGDDLEQHRERIVLGLDASRSLRSLREALGALPSALNGSSPTSALCRCRARLEHAASLGPFRPLRVCHLANHELPRRNLLAHVLELRLACLVISFPTSLRHFRSLPSTSSARQKPAANPAILLTNTIGVGELGVTSRFAPHVIPRPHPNPLNHADSARTLGSKWARLDSNQGPTDYESAALTS